MDKFTLNPAVPGAIDNVEIGLLRPVTGHFSLLDVVGIDGTVSKIGRISPLTVTPAASGAFRVQEGDIVTVTGTVGASGTVARTDSAGAVLTTWPIVSNAPVVIPAVALTQRYSITCTTGSIVASVQDAVLALTSGAVATITGTPVVGQVLTAKLPAGVVGTLQFTRTLTAAPFTKTSIAGATANSVNSLTYTLQSADGGCAIGCDTSNPVSPSAALAVPAVPVSAVPVIVAPTAIGTPATYTTPDTVLSQQWTLDGSDVGGATGATYTQAIADSAKALRVRDTTSIGTAVSLPVLPGVQNLKLSNTVNLRSMLASGDGIIMSIGDSFIAGMSSGGTATSDIGARANSFMARLAGKLTSAGFPASKDSAFGGSSVSTVAAWMTFDPRYNITGSTSVLADTTCRSYGGPTLYMATVGDTITFTPGTAFDTIDLYYLQTTSSGGVQVTVDASSTVLATINTTNATKTLAKTTITCPAGSTSVKITMSATAAHYHAGIATRMAASPKIQLFNGGRSGETIARLFSTPDNTSNLGAFVARQMLANTAASGKKIVLLLNGWYNDYNLNQAGMTPALVLANYKLICDQAVALGVDIWYLGYADTSGAGMSDAVFNSYETPVVALLRDTYNAVIFEEKYVFTSYATYQPLGYYGDSLHLGASGHDKVADTFTAICKLASAGTIAP